MSGFRSVLERKLIQWGLAYLAGAWLMLQVLDLLGGFFGWPAAAGRIATVLLGVGFLGALVLAWYHGEKGAQKVSGPELVMMVSLLIIAGAAVAFVGGGVADPAVDAPRAEGITERAAPRALTPAEQGSIAVLPFADMSPEGDQEYFSDGLAEELLNVLARLPELRVASRTSAFAYKGKDVSIDSIARALRVAHVLEGSVRKAGEKVRITAQLIDARTGYHLWSESYDREIKDIFAVQDEIAKAIVRALELELGGGRAGARLAREETRDPQAHAALLRALHLAGSVSREGYARAVDLLEEATARDPNYARAHASLARIYSTMASRGYGPESLVQRARASAERALALDPQLAEAHLALGIIAHQHERDLRATEAHYRRAVELSPGLARPHANLGWLLMEIGRLEEGIAEAERAAALDPVAPGVLNDLGILYLYAGQPQRALEALRSRDEIQPSPVSLANLGLIYALLARFEEATAAVERARILEADDRWILAVAAFVHARAGQRAEAERAIRALERNARPNPFFDAVAYAGLGDSERMFELLEQAVEERSRVTPHLRYMPMFDPYRNDPRMRRLIARLNEG